ncbi:MAG TPA: hypothetical protein VMF91_26825 [Bryobacteraceae bacterium]|nr:hypothetical protein [Bryobacteraceae bacterium]
MSSTRGYGVTKADRRVAHFRYLGAGTGAKAYLSLAKISDVRPTPYNDE